MEKSHILRVLVVDDEIALCIGMKRSLENFSCEILEAGQRVRFDVHALSSAEECMEKFSELKPDILLLDHKLPGISGMELLERLGMGNERDFIVVMVTAYANLESAVRATKLGAYDILAKPFSPEELRYTVRKAATHLTLSRQSRKLAEEKKKMRFEFLSILSHELKSPLNAVQGYLELLKGHLQGDDLHMIDRSLLRVDGMRKLIFDLLDLTRIESGQKRRDLKEVDLVPVARNAIDLVSVDANARKISLRLDSPDTLPMTADPGEVEIILNNLVSNAVKYNRDGGQAEVTLRRNGDTVIIKVKDTGIGLSPAEASRLFQEFVRIKNSKTIKILGSGLGLSTVRKLARLYGGDATVESTLDVGSAFTVILNDSVKPAPAAGTAEGTPPAQS